MRLQQKGGEGNPFGARINKSRTPNKAFRITGKKGVLMTIRRRKGMKERHVNRHPSTAPGALELPEGGEDI